MVVLYMYYFVLYEVRTAINLHMFFGLVGLLILKLYDKNEARKGKALRKHSLHRKISSFGFIEAVHQW